MLDDLAPRTCAAVWDSLPLGKDVFHGESDGFSNSEVRLAGNPRGGGGKP
jgi:hypothetical protein